MPRSRSATSPKKNLAVILKRLEKLHDIRNYLGVARGQLDLIENSFQLIADQIVTMQSPAELSGQLDDLLDGVESIRQTARRYREDSARDRSVEDHRRRMSDAYRRPDAMPKSLPAWADDLRRRYVRGEASVFVLHGNVYDAVHQRRRDRSR